MEQPITVPRAEFEHLVLAAKAWALVMNVKRSMGEPLVPPGATLSIDGGPRQALTDELVDLDGLNAAVKAGLRRLHEQPV